MTDQVSDKDPVGSATLAVISSAVRFNRWMYEQVQPYLKDRVLEIGSGIGNISRFVIADNYTIDLSDYNPEYKFLLQEKFSDCKNVQNILTIDLTHPNFSEEYKAYKEKYDSLFLLNVIEHLENDSYAVENCRFLLKQSGHLIVLAPAYQFLYCKLDKQLGHYRRYTRQSLSRLLEKGDFNIIRKKYFNLLGIAGWLISGKLLRNKQLGRNEMSAFDSLVPLARLLDRLTFNQMGLSVIIIGKKK